MPRRDRRCSPSSGAYSTPRSSRSSRLVAHPTSSARATPGALPSTGASWGRASSPQKRQARSGSSLNGSLKIAQKRARSSPHHSGPQRRAAARSFPRRLPRSSPRRLPRRLPRSGQRRRSIRSRRSGLFVESRAARGRKGHMDAHVCTCMHMRAHASAGSRAARGREGVRSSQGPEVLIVALRRSMNDANERD